MRILGLDVGTKTIGMAVSDESATIANALKTLRRTRRDADLLCLRTLVEQYGIAEIVVGLPKNMNGSIGERAEQILTFAGTLGEAISSVTVTMWDERLSTVAAEKVLIAADLSRKKRRQIIDTTAAVIILQNYLDYRKRGQ